MEIGSGSGSGSVSRSARGSSIVSVSVSDSEGVGVGVGVGVSDRAGASSSGSVSVSENYIIFVDNIVGTEIYYPVTNPNLQLRALKTYIARKVGVVPTDIEIFAEKPNLKVKDVINTFIKYRLISLPGVYTYNIIIDNKDKYIMRSNYNILPLRTIYEYLSLFTDTTNLYGVDRSSLIRFEDDIILYRNSNPHIISKINPDTQKQFMEIIDLFKDYSHESNLIARKKMIELLRNYSPYFESIF